MHDYAQLSVASTNLCVLTYLAWNSNKFVPVLMESKSYELGHKRTAMYHHIFKIRKGEAFLLLGFESIDEEEHTSEIWSDKLNWHDDNFSFYDKKQEELKYSNANSKLKKNLYKSRLNFLQYRDKMEAINDRFLDQIEIMEVIN
ncbi:MAG: hypothetical protein HQM08_23230 [Candidatus Riflebacteria bacterium]|nr:hypothetical protein [Candidatus Riflebacteria bacterium]